MHGEVHEWCTHVCLQGFEVHEKTKYMLVQLINLVLKKTWNKILNY